MRIAIVNDVALAVEAVRRVVLNSRQDKLAWIAHDGAQAVDLCNHDVPDLILMDLVMPGMDGAEATRRIMARNPCPIVVVTADVRDNSSQVFEAMGAGALDAVNTPVFERPDAPKGAQALLAKIETIRKLIGNGNGRNAMAGTRRDLAQASKPRPCLVAVGASAGGPAALAKVLRSLPADFGAPIVVVQHVDRQFAPGLAHWLGGQVPLPVRLAQDGVAPQPGVVLLAARNEHLVLSHQTKLTYTRQPADCSYRPSIDVFFKSVDRFWPGELVGVLLTGMGRDGAAGLRVLRNHGHHTIAQDEATSAVYGMPKAAAEAQAAREILPLGRIGPRLAGLVRRSKIHV
jgi:two-component system response regulator WspF